MKTRGSLLLAVRFLFGKRGGRERRMWPSILGIGLSLVPLILVLQVADGMIEGITSRFIEVGTYHLQAVATEEQEREKIDELIDVLNRVEGVRLVTYEIQGLGLLSSQAGRTGVTVRCVDPGIWNQDGELRKYFRFSKGRFDLEGEGRVIVGQTIADKLEIRVGDGIKLLTTRNLAGRSLIPRINDLETVGVFKTGYQDLDALWVYISSDLGDRILSWESSRQFLGIKIDDPFGDLNSAYHAIRAELPQGWRLYTWFDLERAQYMSFKTTKSLLVFVMALILVVAAVNISSSLVMLAMEKQQEIGFLKSMGAHPLQIMSSFLLAGFLAGIMGAIIGTGLGVLVSYYVNEIIASIEIVLNLFDSMELLNPEFYLETIPIDMNWARLLTVALFAVILSTLAALFPSRRAARIKPLEVLRKH